MVEVVQKEALRLMKEVDEICRKYDITYYGEGGTAIGALRHEGFIPWDDDMDIVMTRENFNKFVEALKKENIKDRVLEYPEGNEEYPVVTIKYMDTNTTTIFKSLFLDNNAGGLNIDIFILDPIPKGREKWFKRNFLSYCEILCPYYIINNESSYLKYRIDLLKSKIFGKEFVLNSYRKKLFNFDEKDCEEYLIRWGITYQTVKIDYYKEPRYYKFCDMMMPIPKNAERILTNYFGDSWYILPDEQEYAVHDTIKNMKVDYKHYKDDYMPFIDKEKLEKHFLKSKILRMKKIKYEAKLTKKLNLVNYYKDNLIVKEMVNEKEILDLYEKSKYKEVYEKIKDYVAMQKAGVYRKNNLVFEISDELKKCVLQTLINVGKYYDAISLINLYNDFDEINDTLLKIREAKYAYFENNYKKSLEIVDELLLDYEYNMSAYKIKLDIILQEKLKEQECKKLISTIERYLEFTGDIELVKYLGDLYLLMNNKEEALNKYEEFKNNSQNGLLLLDIKIKNI